MPGPFAKAKTALVDTKNAVKSAFTFAVAALAVAFVALVAALRK